MRPLQEAAMTLAPWMLVIVICAGLAVRARGLLTSAVWLALCSAFLAVLVYQLGAAEVAVIELSVGAGLVTVLFVFAINIAGEDSIGLPSVVPRGLALALCLAPLGLVAAAIVPVVLTSAPTGGGVFVNVLWQDRALDVVVQVVLIYAGVLGLLGLLAEKQAPLQQPAAREIAAKREKDLQAMETAARQEEAKV
jgi:uncharacterized MnhB-related membrane protein